MKVAVFLRKVPDIVEEIYIEDGEIDYSETDLVLNEFDDYALEEALIFAEETDAEVIAISMESSGARLFQIASARGANRTIKLTGLEEDQLHPVVLAKLLKEVMTKLEVDVLFTGVQTPGDLYGQLVPIFAQINDWSFASGVIGVELDGAKLKVVQEYGQGRSALLSLQLPAVIGVQAARRSPGYVSGSRLRQAIKETKIEELDLSDSVLEQPSAINDSQLSYPEEVANKATMLGDDADEAVEKLVEILTERGFL